jgi:hypothetical protein
LKAPNYSVCQTKRDITDATTGRLYKGICRVAEGADFSRASSYCIGNGMRLLTIRNEREFDAMVELELISGNGATPGPGIADHVGGAKDSNGVWRFWDGTQIPEFLIPTSGSGSYQNAINVRGNGAGGFNSFAVDYTVPNYYLCEYSLG